MKHCSIVMFLRKDTAFSDKSDKIRKTLAGEILPIQVSLESSEFRVP